MRVIHFATLVPIVGWVERDTGTKFLGFAYLDVPQQSEISSKLANPTGSVADRRLIPTWN